MGNESSQHKANKHDIENKRRASVDETISTLESIQSRHGGSRNIPTDESVQSGTNNNHLLLVRRSTAFRSNSLRSLHQLSPSYNHLTPKLAVSSSHGSLHQLSGCNIPHSFNHSPKSAESSLPPLSHSMPLKRSKSFHKRKRSSILKCHNGITGKYISARICKIAANFWRKNIENLSVSHQLEIGCSIFFGMLSTNVSMKKVMKANLNENKKIEATSLRYLNMMGWLIRYLVTDNIDLYALLTKLGIFHQKMGIQIQHFDPMLQAMHETFAYYFEEKYNIEVKYAMDEIFSISAQVMTGQNLKCSSHLMDITKQFQEDDIPFLKNLDICLKSSIGKEYLYRYLSQTWCEEIALFLQNLVRFKNCMSDKERFMVARDITKISINPTATFCLNLSYETRANAMNMMISLEEKFMNKEEFEITSEFFIAVENEIYKLIMDNHWSKFVESIEILQCKSFNVE